MTDFPTDGPRTVDFTEAQDGFLLAASTDDSKGYCQWIDPDDLGGGGGGGSAAADGPSGSIQYTDGADLTSSPLLTFSEDGNDFDDGHAGMTIGSRLTSKARQAQLMIGNDGDQPDWIVPAIHAEIASDTFDLDVLVYNGTFDSPAATGDTADILGIIGRGLDSDLAVTSAGSIVLKVEGTVTSGAIPTSWRFAVGSASGEIQGFRINSGGAIDALWGIDPVAFFETGSAVENAINAVGGATLYQASSDGSARGTLNFVHSRGSFATPATSAESDVLGRIGFLGTGVAGDADSVNGLSSIIARNRATDQDVIVCDFEFTTTTQELIVKYDGGVVLPHVFANGADPAAPAAGARLYIVNTAGGKQQLAVRFDSGSPQIVATEP